MPSTCRFAFACCLAAGAFVLPARAAAQDFSGGAAPAALSVLPDTTSRIRFDVPAEALSRALARVAAQAGVRIHLEAASSAGVVVRGVSGTYTLPEALRQLLAEVDLRPRFGPGDVVVVEAAGEFDAPVYNLRPIEVVGTRNRGYSAVRSTTATKTDTPLRDTPQAVSVVTRDFISDQSMQGMADVVRFIPGVTMGQGEGHRDAPTIRGNSSTADFFVDGFRDDAQYLRDLYNVERVEALKGSNAMVFGRGGGGGVMNRVTKQPQFAPLRALTLAGGSHDHRRGTLDVSEPLTDHAAVRLNALFEDSRGFRDGTELRRYGVNPTFFQGFGESTALRASYEYFTDERTVDRGIPSFEGKPFETARSTFFGNASASHSRAEVHNGGLQLEHRAGGFTLRNRTRYTAYDKFYQNSYASGAVNAAGTHVNLGAYNNWTGRSNAFNQTDVLREVRTGSVRHTLLAGVEVGRQRTDNFRETGYYAGDATSWTVSVAQPNVDVPIAFRQSATDADNGSVVEIAAAYVQDQLAITRHLQAVAGLRFERFDVAFHNNRNDTDITRRDQVLSPRAGLVLKPVESASLYGSYSVSHLPSAGDQFSSLSATTQALEPEQFTNYELGGKWDVDANLSLALAAYRLDRTNTSSPDPADAAKLVQTGSQRTRGVEASLAGDLTGRWHVVAAAAVQRAEITSRTSSAAAGARVPLVPEKTFSLWSRYNVRPGLGLGVGVVRQDDMFAAIDNQVTLPGFTRVDGALFVRLGTLLNAQLNVENVLDTEYFATSHGNNNILPGAGRALRVTLTTRR